MPDYIFDHSEYNFSKRFKALRDFYKLSSRDMAALLNYKSPSNISYFEKYPMSNKPSYQALISIQQLFGISIDWMLGISNEPYNNESLTCAETEQDNRFIVEVDEIAQNPDTPESIIRSLKNGVFPRLVIQRKLLLQDRFTLIFLLNYLSFSLTQYYIENRSGILRKKLHGLLEILGLEGNSKLNLNSNGVAHTLKKHPDYAVAFFKFFNTLKSPLCDSYEEHPYKVKPGQFSIKKLDHSILDETWDIISYLERNDIKAKRPKEPK